MPEDKSLIYKIEAQTERTIVVIELFAIYKEFFSSHYDSFWWPEKCHNIFFQNVHHIPVILI